MSSLTLYYMPESGPCRTVMLVANYLGIKLDTKSVDLMKFVQRSEWYLKINPQHAIPVLIDGDLTLSESRAIITYLCDKYEKDESIYPKDIKKRALVHQRLYFDMGTLYQPIIDYYGVTYYGAKKFNEEKWPKVEEGFKILDTYLENEEYLVCDQLTLADFAVVSSVATAVAVFDFDVKKYKNAYKWFSKMQNILPDYEEIIEKNGKRLRELVDIVVARNNSQ